MIGGGFIDITQVLIHVITCHHWVEQVISTLLPSKFQAIKPLLIIFFKNLPLSRKKTPKNKASFVSVIHMNLRRPSWDFCGRPLPTQVSPKQSCNTIKHPVRVMSSVLVRNSTPSSSSERHYNVIGLSLWETVIDKVLLIPSSLVTYTFKHLLLDVYVESSYIWETIIHWSIAQAVL